MTEADWQRQVIDLARLFKWRVAHFRPAMTKHGWVTPVAADGKGWPDLVLVRERLIAAELKSEKGKLAPDQEAWRDALDAAGIPVYTWRPSDWESIVEILRKREDSPKMQATRVPVVAGAHSANAGKGVIS